MYPGPILLSIKLVMFSARIRRERRIPPVKRLFARMLMLAIIANLPMLSHSYAAAPHSHREPTALHHDGHEAVSADHQHVRHAATKAETSSSCNETAANPRSTPQDPGQPCCTLVGGMCVTLISEAPPLLGRQLPRAFQGIPSAALVGDLFGVSPPPPKLMP